MTATYQLPILFNNNAAEKDISLVVLNGRELESTTTKESFIYDVHTEGSEDWEK